MKDKPLGREIAEAASDFDRMAAETERLAALYEPRGKAVFVDAGAHAKAPFDKTMLLLEGQKRAPVAIVRDAGMITLAAAFDSGIDFVEAARARRRHADAREHQGSAPRRGPAEAQWIISSTSQASRFRSPT